MASRMALFPLLALAAWAGAPMIAPPVHSSSAPAGFPASAQRLPQIISVQILRLGQPVDALEAGTRAKDYRITITGTGFDSSSKVFLRGAKIPAAIISATEIVARVPAPKLLPGEAALQVVNRSDGTASNTVAIDIISNSSILNAGPIVPSAAMVGDQITVQGTGFTPTENRVRFVRAANPAMRGVTVELATSDGSSLSLPVPASVCAICPTALPCPALCFPIEPGEYLLAVTNANGLSNSAGFLVSSATGPIGAWGGQNIGVRVTDTEIEIEGSCFSGLVPQALATDQQGNFNLAGSYTPLVGPVRQGHQGIPAQFTGTVNGNTMTLTITVNSQTVGPFTLGFGEVKTILHPCV